MKESRTRSLVKALGWRIVATTTTILVTRAVTGSWKAAVGVGIIETSAKLLLHYGYERVWTTVKWGTTDE